MANRWIVRRLSSCSARCCNRECGAALRESARDLKWYENGQRGDREGDGRIVFIASEPGPWMKTDGEFEPVLLWSERDIQRESTGESDQHRV